MHIIDFTYSADSSVKQNSWEIVLNINHIYLLVLKTLNDYYFSAKNCLCINRADKNYLKCKIYFESVTHESSDIDCIFVELYSEINGKNVVYYKFYIKLAMNKDINNYTKYVYLRLINVLYSQIVKLIVVVININNTIFGDFSYYLNTLYDIFSSLMYYRRFFNGNMINYINETKSQ